MKLSIAFLITTAVTASVASAATVTTRYVNNNSRVGNCPGQYATIQSAVSAANPGDTVLVCNGVYPEQVTITNPITLEGQSGATIQPVNATVNASDPNPAVAIVYVNGVTGATVTGLIVDGSLANVNSGCSPDFLGIYYSGSSGTISHNSVRFIEQEASLFGCQTGLAIYADDPSSATLALTIGGNSVHDFQKNGITAVDTGLTVSITGNTILGAGPTSQIAQNGIQVGPGASGTVATNNAAGFVYTPCVSVTNCPASSTGILVYDTAGVGIASNTLGQSQGAIFVYSDSSGPEDTQATISKNQISDTLVYDGIGVQSTGNTISSNVLANSGESGVALYDGDNQVTGNTIVEAPVGILIAAAGNPGPTGNKNLDVVQPIETSIPAARPSHQHVQPVRLH